MKTEEEETMKQEKALKTRILLPFVGLIFMVSGCNLPLEKLESPATSIPATISPTVSIPQEPTPQEPIAATPKAEIVHKDLPGSPIGKINQTVHDQVDENTAPQKQAFGGDDFKNGKYERPFDQNMNYLPLADLVTIQLNREDPLWVYVLFKVDKPFTSSPSANTHFMVEIDTDLDNRGDVLIVTGTPISTDWSTESVLVLRNPDINVGGTIAVKPDPVLTEGRGYYEEVFNNGQGDDPDLAWSRLSKVDPSIAQIAFKNTITGGEKGKFIWLPWTDAGMLDRSLFEYNDHFTFEQAGYPLKEDVKNYPIKALWGVDNTCRVPSGFTPTGTMPGLCPNYDPAPSRSDGPPACIPSPNNPCR